MLVPSSVLVSGVHRGGECWGETGMLWGYVPCTITPSLLLSLQPCSRGWPTVGLLSFHRTKGALGMQAHFSGQVCHGGPGRCWSPPFILLLSFGLTPLCRVPEPSQGPLAVAGSVWTAGGAVIERHPVMSHLCLVPQNNVSLYPHVDTSWTSMCCTSSLQTVLWRCILQSVSPKRERDREN